MRVMVAAAVLALLLGPASRPTQEPAPIALAATAPVAAVPAAAPGWTPAPVAGLGDAVQGRLDTVRPEPVEGRTGEPSNMPAVAAAERPAMAPDTPLGSARATLHGAASWFATPGLTAAAGPTLRRWLGRRWRGQLVKVCAGGRCVVVALTDWCQCHKGTRGERLIDLSNAAFARLAPLRSGLVRVTIRRLHVRPPATDAR